MGADEPESTAGGDELSGCRGLRRLLRRGCGGAAAPPLAEGGSVDTGATMGSSSSESIMMTVFGGPGFDSTSPQSKSDGAGMASTAAAI